jgi:hypothetical protein
MLSLGVAVAARGPGPCDNSFSENVYCNYRSLDCLVSPEEFLSQLSLMITLRVWALNRLVWKLSNAEGDHSTDALVVRILTSPERGFSPGIQKFSA